MQVCLLASYRSLRKHPSRLKIRRKWVREADQVARSVFVGVWGETGACEGMNLERVLLFILDPKSRPPKILCLVQLMAAGVNSVFISTWTVILKLEVNHKEPKAGRILETSLSLQPLLNSYPCKHSITEKRAFEGPVFQGVDLDGEGKFVIPHSGSYAQIHNVITRCIPQSPSSTYKMTIKDLLTYFKNFLEEMSAGNTKECRLLHGSSSVNLFEDPHSPMLRWMKEHYRRTQQTGGDTTALQTEILTLLAAQASILEAVNHFVIDPLLQSESASCQSLVETVKLLSLQLKEISSDPSRFEELFPKLVSVNWTKIICWTLASNRSFFDDHLGKILKGDEITVREAELLSRFRPICRSMTEGFAQIVKEMMTNGTKKLAMGKSNYLLNSNCRLEETSGQTLCMEAVPSHSSSSPVYQDYYLALERQTLVMWKTTTAEDRARGKIYLRGFTKVDPVEDRLKM